VEEDSDKKTRVCTYPEMEKMKETKEPYDNDYDSKMPCKGDAMEVDGKDGTDMCNAESCELSTLVFLMDTTGSFSGVDQNSALTLANGIIDGLNKAKVMVPKYRYTTVNDPKVEVMDPVTMKDKNKLIKKFKDTLKSIYTKSHPSGGDWAEQSTLAIVETLKKAAFGEVFCLFTDAPTHQLNLKAEILRRKKEQDIPIFVFLTPDYNIYSSKIAQDSYRLYQNISSRHTYIMSQTDPSSLVILIDKYLRSNKMGCRTFGGMTERVKLFGSNTMVTRKWQDGPDECQFPFWYQGNEYHKCTTESGTSQPWCATMVAKNKKGQPEMVPGMWGFCGDCGGEIRAECKKGGHKMLTDSWRSIKGKKPITKPYKDDFKLTRQWFRFNVTGTTNTMPLFKKGVTATQTCGSGSVHGSIELESKPNLEEAVPYDAGILEKRICFDPMCANFRRVEVLWCPPDPIGTPGEQKKEGKPFHIFRLKPLKKLGHNFGYCVL